MEEHTTQNAQSVSIKIRSGLRGGKALGDAVYDFTHATGIYKIAEGYTRLTGNDCGCDERQEFLNQLFPG